MIQLAIPFPETRTPHLSAADRRAIKREFALSNEVKAEALAVYRSRPLEFLWFDPDLLAVKRKHDLGIYFNDTILALHRDGCLEERKVYFGAESPVGGSDLAGRRKLKKGEKPPLPYLGYRVEYRYLERSAVWGIKQYDDAKAERIAA